MSCLFGLQPGNDLSILSSFFIEKRRDGALRSGWALRHFILTTSSLHYYRHVEATQYLGEERGSFSLSEIHTVVSLKKEENYTLFEISNVRNKFISF